MIVICSSEIGQSSLTSDAFGGTRPSWGFGSNEDDADSGSRASWGPQSNPPSTQVDVCSFECSFERLSFFFLILYCNVSFSDRYVPSSAIMMLFFLMKVDVSF